MQVRLLLLLFTGILVYPASAQDSTVHLNDSSRMLETVTVRAFEQNKQLKEVSAAVVLVDRAQLNRFGNTSLLPAINNNTGVRMEERSPGSYRLNIRGSTLRSPFGVRNVKVYWNDIPFTDPGGNTYLNQLALSNIQSVEIIKGPAGSIYGAGTGGAMLLQSQSGPWQPGVSAGFTGGSFNTQSWNLAINTGSEAAHNSFTYSHQTSDGYRLHTAMRRDIGTWETRFNLNNNQSLSTQFLYGDLYYQTPGALTAKEYLANPKAYRPAAGGFPDAEQVQAAIYQKMVLAGITHQYKFSDRLSNKTTVYGAFVQFTNPTFRTYEKRSEPQLGGRTVFNFHQQAGRVSVDWVTGAEAQRGFFNTKDFKNKQGRPDSLQTDDDINSWIYQMFLQADVKLPGNWSITAGASLNRFHVSDQRLSDPSLQIQERTYSNQLAPRIAVSKKIKGGVWLYASAAKGFSPPAIAEVLPPSRTISTSLEAEKGVNYEAGIKANWLHNRLYFEMNAFYFRLEDAIVQRQQVNAANYYVNAGGTKQKGLESQLAYQLFSEAHQVVRQARVWINYTWNDFRYEDFKQLAADYSGKQMPSVAKNTVSAGADVSFKCGFYTNLSYYYSDRIAMNDANTDFAGSYQLLGIRTGFRTSIKKLLLDVFAGGDNLFDIRYSLGNDINAAAGRYYNAAAGRNFFAGCAIQWVKCK